jgi:hypothetical protein
VARAPCWYDAWSRETTSASTRLWLHVSVHCQPEEAQHLGALNTEPVASFGDPLFARRELVVTIMRAGSQDDPDLSI